MPNSNTPGDSFGPEPDEPAGLSKTGMLTVAAILGLAVVLGLLNFVYQQRRTARSLEYWGAAHRALIAAEDVQVLLLEPFNVAPADGPPAGTADEFLHAGGQAYRVAQRKDAQSARGLLHVRRALLDDGAYDWNEPEPATAPVYRYALRLVDQRAANVPEGSGTVVVLFNRDGTWVRASQAERALAVRPNAQGVPPFAAFLAEQFPGEGQATATNSDRDDQSDTP